MIRKLVGTTLALGLTMGLVACGGSETSGDDATQSIGDQLEYKIVGIDPGAGLMKSTKTAIEEYGLEDWELIEGSGAAMAAALKKAYNKEEPIIVTGWTPHWKFSEFDLKYLEDPKGVYGADEDINTIARVGLNADHPTAYAILDQFKWTPEDMANVMVDVMDGVEAEEAATSWIENNADTVASWTDGAGTVDGDEIMLAYVAWDSEIASTNIIAKVLESVGYDVTLRQVEAGPMWSGVADGSVDAHVAGWLPTTHADYYEKFDGQFEDLGANLEGTKIGLVVPTYMDIDSIEDLLNE